MGAATEFYGYLLSKGYKKQQVERFVDLANRAEIGIISPNQAYKKSLENGWLGVDGYYNQDGEPVQGEKSAFKDWINNIRNSEWLDKGINLIGGLATGEYDPETGESDVEPLSEEEEIIESKTDDKKIKGKHYLIGGLAVLGVGLLIYYNYKKK
jgi:hypothetical protein